MQIVHMQHLHSSCAFAVPFFPVPLFSVFVRSLFGRHSVLIRYVFGGVFSAVRRGRLQGAGLRVGETLGEAHAGLSVDGSGRAGVQREVRPSAEDAPALQGVQVRQCYFEK